MKKNLFLIVLILLATGVVKSQNDSAQFRKWAVGVAYNSVEAQMNQYVIDGWGEYPYSNLSNYLGDQKNRSCSFSLLVNRSLNANASIRIETGFTSYYFTSYYNAKNDSNATPVFGPNFVKCDTIKQQSVFMFAGINWKLMRTRRLYVYAGFNIGAARYGPSRWSDYLGSNSSPDYELWTGITPGGYTFGIGSTTGFAVNVIKNLAIGTEFMFSLQYYELGGVQSGTHYAPANPTYPRNWSISNNVSSGFQFSKIRPSLNVTYQF